MKVLMVCLGNICRSPMAEGVLRHLANERGARIEVDSAGTSNYHVGDSPDHRAQATMANHGMDISDLRGRQLTTADLDRFDAVLVMDKENLRNTLALATTPSQARKVRLIMDHAPAHPSREVPDPYYGGDEGFEAVHAMLMEACNNLLADVER